MKQRHSGPITREEASFLMGKKLNILNPVQYRARRAVLVSFILVLLMTCLNILAGIDSFRTLTGRNASDLYVRQSGPEHTDSTHPAPETPRSDADTAPADVKTGAEVSAPVSGTARGAAPESEAGKPPGLLYSQIHLVVPGDSFYRITLDYWGEKWLWPGMYYYNREMFADPDLIFPGDEITVYPSPGVVSDLSEASMAEMMEAYLYVYRRYKELQTGEKARWVLYSACKLNRSFPEEYHDRIDDEDLAVLRRDLLNHPPGND